VKFIKSLKIGLFHRPEQQEKSGEFKVLKATKSHKVNYGVAALDVKF